MSESDPTAKCRISIYKNKGKDTEEMRRRRNEVTVEIRKNKREECLLKRRNVPVDHEENRIEEETLEDFAKTHERLAAIITDAQSCDLNIQLSAVQTIRKLVGSSRDPPIDLLIEARVLPILVQAIHEEDNPQLHFEAAWALTNMASGTSKQTRAVVEANAVPPLIDLLKSPHANVREQAVWGLGNIIGDGPILRDYCIRLGALEPLLNFVEADTPLTFLRHIAWVFVNICRHTSPPPSLDTVTNLIPAIRKFMTHQDIRILVDTIWTIAHISYSGNDYIQAIVDSGVVPSLVDKFNYPEIDVQTSALRAIGTILTGTDEHSQTVLDCGALKYFHGLLANPSGEVTKDALWCLSNLMAGYGLGIRSFIQAVLDMGLVAPIMHHLADSNSASQREAAWAISNVCAFGSAEQIRFLVRAGVVPPLCDLLDVYDPDVVVIALNTLRTMLSKWVDDADVPSLHLQIEECDGLSKIENLQVSQNDEIFSLAVKIIEEDFTDEEVSDDLMPVGDAEAFEFGKSQPAVGFQF